MHHFKKPKPLTASFDISTICSVQRRLVCILMPRISTIADSSTLIPTKWGMVHDFFLNFILLHWLRSDIFMRSRFAVSFIVQRLCYIWLVHSLLPEEWVYRVFCYAAGRYWTPEGERTDPCRVPWLKRSRLRITRRLQLLSNDSQRNSSENAGDTKCNRFWEKIIMPYSAERFRYVWRNGLTFAKVTSNSVLLFSGIGH